MTKPTPPSSQGRSFCLLGAPFDTGNLGVSALGESVVRGIAAREPSARITVFDHGVGVRPNDFAAPSGSIHCENVGAKLTKRVHQPESFWRIARAARRGGGRNPAARRFLDAEAILDISGGDSFTDLYGPWRFDSMTRFKRLALELGKPLVLLPQTYGPFKEAEHARIASEICRGARLAWARDERSFEVLRELLGDEYDPERHRSGVDVAFALPRTDPGAKLDEHSGRWLDEPSGNRVGLNVSGLLWNSPSAAREQYGFKSDYREIITLLARQLLAESDVRLLLVPHVLTPPGHYESDFGACQGLVESLGLRDESRVTIARPDYAASEIKWIIARCEWFCGTRMHSTIAGLSSRVPTAAIAYSPKTLGVFETCTMGEHVADPRESHAEEVVERLMTSYRGRVDAKQGLDAALPGVLERAEAQLDAIVGLLSHQSIEPAPDCIAASSGAA